jgi:hypothetical protein
MRHVQPGNPSNYADLQRLALFILGVLCAGALLSVPLFLGTQWGLQALHITSANARSWPLTEIVKADFPRFFNRAILISALIGLPLMIRASRSSSRKDRPLPGTANFASRLRSPIGPDLRQWLTGFLLAAGLLLTLGWAYCRAGVYEMNPKPGWTALRSMGARSALFWTTSIFAIVHFLKPPESFSLPASQVSWHSGFDIIGAIFGHFGNLDFILAEFFTLFAVGWVVGQARLTTGSLWPGIGLHGGWVFGLKYFSVLTHGSKALNRGHYLPWIGENLKIGLFPLAVVLFTGWLASLGWQRVKPERF